MHPNMLQTSSAARLLPIALAALLALAPNALGQFVPGKPVGKPAPIPSAPVAPSPKVPDPKPADPKPADAAPAQPPAPDPSQQITTTITVKPAALPFVIAPSTWKPGQPITTSDDLLAALENADAGFRSLQSDLRKTKTRSEIEGGGQLIYEGRVMFRSDPATPPNSKPQRMFQVDFTSLTADNVRRPEVRTFIFDGAWFVERQPDVKQIHKRRVVPPGETIDPLAIGEGPFPIPIGQKRERILQRFSAELRPADDFPDAAQPGVALPPNLKDTYQLKLIPRATAQESKQFHEIRIWYRKSDLLPRIARTIDRDDAINVFLLTNIKLNETLPPGAFDTTVPPGWDAQVDEYRKPADPSTSVAPATQPATP